MRLVGGAFLAVVVKVEEVMASEVVSVTPNKVNISAYDFDINTGLSISK